MLGLLYRLESRRQALRSRVMGALGVSDDTHFGLAVFVVLVVLVPPASIALPFTLFPAGGLALLFVLAGFFAILTLFLLPAAILLF